jgi:site-specific recombinase XerD
MSQHLTLVREMHERAMRELLGHKDVRTTQMYTHVLESNTWAIQSPADEL